jgi:dipeptidase D
MTDAASLLRPYKVDLLKQLPSAQEHFFKWFLAITELHRPTFECAAASATVIGWARALGASVKTDEAGNILISLPASPGKESVPSLCIQGHLDIVTVGTYEEGGQVPVKIVDGTLTSGVSTLGADDGVAIAAMFALLETEKTFVHGPLEFLVTLDEEQGIVGAGSLAGPPFLQSRSLLNLDSEDWGRFFTSCAGSIHIIYTFTGSRADFAGTAVRVSLSNFVSGHTGICIAEGRANAVKWLVRLLQSARSGGVNFTIANISGGTRHNAIPAEAEADIIVDNVPLFTEILEKAHAISISEVQSIETKGPALSITPVGAKQPYDVTSSQKLVNLLSTIPHGVFMKHLKIPGLVNTSQSLSVVRTEGDTVIIDIYARSNEATQMDWLVQTNTALGELASLPVVVAARQQPWPAALGGKIVAAATAAYVELFGKEPIITGVHAGLECGVIQNRGYPDLEAVSIGPDVNGAHTIEEMTTVSSCVDFYRLTLQIVTNWAT